MEALLRDAVDQLKKTISYLEKLKLDKRQKPERDNLVSDLKQSVEKYDRKLTEGGNGDEQTYNDVVVDSKPPPVGDDVYNDVQPETYDDVANTTRRRSAANDNDAIYDDTDVEGGMQYDDVSPHQIHMTECEKLANPTIADFVELKKEGKVFLKSSWQKRWCVLHRGILYLYDNPKDKRQKEAFWVSGYQYKLRDDIKDAKRKERCFDLRNNNKVYEFCATDKASLTKWQWALGGSPNKSMPNNEEMNYDDVSVDQSHLKPKGGMFAGKRPNKREEESFYNDTADPQDVYEETSGGGDTTYDDTAAQTYDDTAAVGFPPPVADDVYEDTAPPPPQPAPARREQMPLPPPPGGLAPRRGPSGRDELPPLPTSPKPMTGFSPGPPALPQREETGSASGTYARGRPPMPLPGRELPPPPSPDPPRGSELQSPLSTEPEEVSDDGDSLEGFGESKDDYVNMYQGMWNCDPDEDNELKFKRGEIIHILSREYDNYGWWTAESRHEEIGLVPVSYLMKAFDV